MRYLVTVGHLPFLLYIISHTTLKGQCHHLHFTDKGTEVERLMALPKTPQLALRGRDLPLGLSASKEILCLCFWEKTRKGS